MIYDLVNIIFSYYYNGSQTYIHYGISEELYSNGIPNEKYNIDTMTRYMVDKLFKSRYLDIIQKYMFDDIVQFCTAQNIFIITKMNDKRTLMTGYNKPDNPKMEYHTCGDSCDECKKIDIVNINRCKTIRKFQIYLYTQPVIIIKYIDDALN